MAAAHDLHDPRGDVCIFVAVDPDLFTELVGDTQTPLGSSDADTYLAVHTLVRELEARDITVLLKGVRPEHLRILHAVGVLDRLAHERHIFDHLPDAIAHARTHVTRDPRHDAA